MINELDLVALKRPQPDHRLELGAVGTVVMVHDGGYTLEFVAFDGDTVAIVTVPADDVRPLRPGELAYVHEPAE
jgi:Domain of unknown function (DUF4926)